MLRSFFSTAWRNILRYKIHSSINFIGLTSGLTVALLIFVYTENELSFDRFHQKSDRLYRFSYLVPNGLKLASTPPPIEPVLKEFFPLQIEEAARVYGRNVSIRLPEGNESFEETDVYFADSAFTKMFDLQFIAGDSRRALQDKYTVLINEEMAAKYFGTKNPIGESLLFSGAQLFKVAGVVKNFPENSHLRFNMLAPYDDMFELEDEKTEAVLRANLARNFVISHSYTYVLLQKGASYKSVNEKMDEFVKKYAAPQLQIGQKFQLMPITDIHLKSDLQAEPTATNSMSNIYVFIFAGIFTLLIACINYVNLSTAQSLTRIKEIGIRKILGSMKYQLIAQFLAESFLFCLIALGLSFMAFYFTLPLLNLLTGKNLHFEEVVSIRLIFAAIGLLVLITFLAGAYPAFFVTRFESVSSLKGAGFKEHGSQWLRRLLVVIQLAVACILVSGSLFIVKQMDYLNTRPLGFDRENIISIPLFNQNLNGFFKQKDTTFLRRVEIFRNTIGQIPGVESTALTSDVLGTGSIYRGIIPEGFTQQDNLLAASMSVEYDFLSSFGMELIAGRSFSRENAADQNEAFMVNESAVREFKWGTPEQAIGKTIDREGKKGKVIGVIKDFNFSALTTPISALILAIEPSQFHNLSVRMNTSNPKQEVQQIEKEWNRIFPEKAFEYSFLEDQLTRQYSNYQDFGSIIQSFSVIAILIASLGVYGLVLFAVQRKVKEIGVRKVLGASVASMLYLIYKDFVLLVFVGFAIAVPVSYALLKKWLANFIYHTDQDIPMYGLSFLTMLILVTMAVGYQVIQAANTNPVNSLRSE